MIKLKYLHLIIFVFSSVLLISSCKKFFDPKQDINITETDLYKDWYEYRAVEMGMYALQAKLVEQLVVLGELRGDLLQITPNADADLVEIYNFNISKNNKYASPINFFKLISDCNNLLRVLEKNHPEVTKPKIDAGNYDKLYGEVLCMRAWTYFNAARIYGKVPFIHESLTTIEEIEAYINSSGTYTDSIYISFAPDGYHNDTVYNQPIVLEKQMFDLPMIIDFFTNQLETKVKTVGVNHHQDNGDNSWDITIWGTYSMHALLGQMYLTQGNYAKAVGHFETITKNSAGTYQLDNTFSSVNWINIFRGINNEEHIFTIPFSKANFQQNDLQNFFDSRPPNKFMIKPTKIAIDKWETLWWYQVFSSDPDPRKKMTSVGYPGDINRAFSQDQNGCSYAYVDNSGEKLPFFNSSDMDIPDGKDWWSMANLRARGDDRSSRNIMNGYDTVVYKYSIDKDPYDHDANFIVYRASGIHLYLAEIYCYWVADHMNTGNPSTSLKTVLNIVNDGYYYSSVTSRLQRGIRGRTLPTGFLYPADHIQLGDYIYTHDPYTNEITGYMNLTNNIVAKQHYLEEQVLDEKAREMAFEGERFYDLIRAAKRRNDPSFLAKIVSAKFPVGQQTQIYNYLMDEKNWYIKYFEQ